MLKEKDYAKELGLDELFAFKKPKPEMMLAASKSNERSQKLADLLEEVRQG